jgi:protein gp37
MTSKIEWTKETWNPVTGCTKVSSGCKNCYAFDLHDKRHRAFSQGKLQNCPQYAEPFSVIQFIPKRLDAPLHWRKPRRIFVNSMSDLFHEAVTDEQIQAVLNVCAKATQHTFQILTKRPERLTRFSYPPNVWIGVTVEDQNAADQRIPRLQAAKASVRFLSCEPLLEPVNLDLDGIDWVIIGGETGRNSRLMQADWGRDIQRQCANAKVAFFMKQMTNKGAIPNDLMIREYPV